VFLICSLFPVPCSLFPSFVTIALLVLVSSGIFVAETYDLSPDTRLELRVLDDCVLKFLRWNIYSAYGVQKIKLNIF
jgi:hypothetical protein